ncbi:hypothetical protein SVIOM342S_09984 [Streptomyces violaceorubidus]
MRCTVVSWACRRAQKASGDGAGRKCQHRTSGAAPARASTSRPCPSRNQVRSGVPSRSGRSSAGRGAGVPLGDERRRPAVHHPRVPQQVPHPPAGAGRHLGVAARRLGGRGQQRPVGHGADRDSARRATSRSVEPAIQFPLTAPAGPRSAASRVRAGVHRRRCRLMLLSYCIVAKGDASSLHRCKAGAAARVRCVPPRRRRRLRASLSTPAQPPLSRISARTPARIPDRGAVLMSRSFVPRRRSARRARRRRARRGRRSPRGVRPRFVRGRAAQAPGRRARRPRARSPSGTARATCSRSSTRRSTPSARPTAQVNHQAVDIDAKLANTLIAAPTCPTAASGTTPRSAARWSTCTT